MQHNNNQKICQEHRSGKQRWGEKGTLSNYEWKKNVAEERLMALCKHDEGKVEKLCISVGVDFEIVVISKFTVSLLMGLDCYRLFQYLVALHIIRRLAIARPGLIS